MIKKRNLVNVEIRDAISQAGLRHFEVFDELGISQPTWTRLLCRPLSEENKRLILDTIKKLSIGR